MADINSATPIVKKPANATPFHIAAGGSALVGIGLVAAAFAKNNSLKNSDNPSLTEFKNGAKTRNLLVSIGAALILVAIGIEGFALTRKKA